MQSAKSIANICDCHRSFLCVFAIIFAVFFALRKKYFYFLRFYLRSAKYIANICGIFYAVQKIPPKYTLFCRKYLRNYMRCQKNANFCAIICASLTIPQKNTAIFCGNVHGAKNTADLPHKYCSKNYCPVHIVFTETAQYED